MLTYKPNSMRPNLVSCFLISLHRFFLLIASMLYFWACFLASSEVCKKRVSRRTDWRGDKINRRGRRAISIHFLRIGGMLGVCGRNMVKLFTARWRLLISIGTMMEAPITITMTDPKFVGRSIIARDPPMSRNIRMVNPKSLIISTALTSILMSPDMFLMICRL